MRILVANDSLSEAGGVQTYLDSAIASLMERGHAVAVAHSASGGTNRVTGPLARCTRFEMAAPNADRGVAAIRQWAPDICYSHNMHDLDVDRQLIGIAPVVKFMHGYFGTCISGHKMHAFPRSAGCDRVFGPACMALYLPRRCGRLSPVVMVNQWRWAGSQRALLTEYAAVVVASEHMRREYLRHGGRPADVRVNPLFPTAPVDVTVSPVPDDPHVAFLGRMTTLKGGDLLIRAVHYAAARLGRPIRLTMIGDGPQRMDWQELAARLGVTARFTGWLTGHDRWALLRTASVLAVPSLWPEPFGLVGLEAAAVGVPAVAVQTGGIGEWLRAGIGGVAVEAPASPQSFGDALVSALADRDRLAELRAGAHRIARTMTLDDHVDRLESIFAAARLSRQTPGSPALGGGLVARRVV